MLSSHAQWFTLILDLHSRQRETKSDKCTIFSFLVFLPTHFRNNSSSGSWSSELRPRRFASMTPRGSNPVHFLFSLYRHVTRNRFTESGLNHGRRDGLSTAAGHYSCHLKYPAENIRSVSRSNRNCESHSRVQTGIMQKGFSRGEMEEELLCRPLVAHPSPPRSTVSPP